MGPELKDARGNEAQEDNGEEGDVVDAVLGLHSWDEGRTPDVVLDRRTHNDTDGLFLPLLAPRRRKEENGVFRASDRGKNCLTFNTPTFSRQWFDEVMRRKREPSLYI